MRKVVVRGVGAVTPLGADLASSWSALLRGEMALRVGGGGAAGAAALSGPLQDYPLGRALLEEAVAREQLSPKELRRLDPVVQLALCASREAMGAAGQADDLDPARFGVVMGVGYGSTTTHLQTMDKLQAGKSDRLSPFTIPASMPNAAASQLAMAFGARGPALTVGTACASGSDAVGMAWQMLQGGTVDRVLCGGAEWIGDDMGVGGMAAAKALAKVDAGDGDTTVLRPFDVDRKGTAVGTGAAMFVLEAVEDPTSIPAGSVLLLGYGCTSDAHHITAPLPDGSGAEAAMRIALQAAQLEPSAIQAIYTHGTGTPLNDAMEAQAIARLFDPPPPITSTKAQYGHAMGASGAINLAFAVATARDGQFPATQGCANPDPELPIRAYLPGDPAPQITGPILVNAFGFGGHNASLVVSPAR
ncbi:MAG: beta-ketoacyl-[acyl-carrier-protein] synthase family protein [Planctomycetota bacterium]|jgi:3-oxoacyl-[acyl-carrier-protein] synthase II